MCSSVTHREITTKQFSKASVCNITDSEYQLISLLKMLLHQDIIRLSLPICRIFGCLKTNFITDHVVVREKWREGGWGGRKGGKGRMGTSCLDPVWGRIHHSLVLPWGGEVEYVLTWACPMEGEWGKATLTRGLVRGGEASSGDLGPYGLYGVRWKGTLTR